MPLVQGDRVVMSETMLPDDPEDGQIFGFPNEQTIGGANVINISKGGQLLGAISQVAPIANVSGKYEATRVTSSIPLKEKAIVRIQGWQYEFATIKFVESFGWVGYETTNTPVPLMDKHMRILAVFQIGEKSSGFYLYEKVCLEVIKGETDAKPKNPPATPG